MFMFIWSFLQVLHYGTFVTSSFCCALVDCIQVSVYHWCFGDNYSE